MPSSLSCISRSPKRCVWCECVAEYHRRLIFVYIGRHPMSGAAVSFNPSAMSAISHGPMEHLSSRHTRANACKRDRPSGYNVLRFSILPERVFSLLWTCYAWFNGVVESRHTKHTWQKHRLWFNKFNEFNARYWMRYFLCETNGFMFIWLSSSASSC